MLFWQPDMGYSLVYHTHDLNPKCSFDHELHYNFDLEN
jgi:hypothetical protein